METFSSRSGSWSASSAGPTQAPLSPPAGGGGASADAGLQVAAQRGRQKEGALPDVVAALARADFVTGLRPGFHLHTGRALGRSAIRVMSQERMNFCLA